MKHINYVTKITNPSASDDAKPVEGTQPKAGCKPVGLHKGVLGSGDRSKVKGSSITLKGDGNHSGSDQNNSMSLSDSYREVVLPKREGEDGFVANKEKKVCVSCGSENPGTALGNWAFTIQQSPICQICAKERAGV